MSKFKTISIIGEKSTSVKMFILEFAWVLSNKHEVFCHISDESLYDVFSEKEINATTFGNLTIINNYNELLLEENKIDFLINDELTENTDVVIFVLNQNTLSIKVLNFYSKIIENSERYLVFLDFIDCEFDDEYFKKYYLDKVFLDSIKMEFYLGFDERVGIKQIENQLNRFVDLKKYPRSRKIKLLSMVEQIQKEPCMKYKEFYKMLDERMSAC